MLLPYLLTAAAFAVLFAKPAALLARDWWSNPEAGHGLLLFPVALWLAWRRGLVAERRRAPTLGLAVLAGAILLRGVSELAAELFTMRLSMVLAAGALVMYYLGLRQLRAWWLPFTLLVLSIPLPELVTSTLALPLQFRASRMGAALLEWRDIPVRLDGNIIHLPGRQLFVTEACSGLRSLTALISIGVMFAGLFLRTGWARALVIGATIPVAILINGFRVFMTGFLVYFVDPKLGEGFMHVTEGWLLFLISLLLVSLVGAALHAVESRVGRHKVVPDA
jgi:exosortase